MRKIVMLGFVIAWGCSTDTPTAVEEDFEPVASVVRDYQSLSNVYFFLDASHRSAFPSGPASRDLIDAASVRVFVNDQLDETDARDRATPTSAYASWTDEGVRIGAPDETGMFHEMDRSLYLVDSRGYLLLTGLRVSSGSSVGVVYETWMGGRGENLSWRGRT